MVDSLTVLLVSVFCFLRKTRRIGILGMQNTSLLGLGTILRRKEGSKLLFSVLSTKIEKDGDIVFYNDAQNEASTALLKISALIAEEYGGNPTYHDSCL